MYGKNNQAMMEKFLLKESGGGGCHYDFCLYYNENIPCEECAYDIFDDGDMPSYSRQELRVTVYGQ